MKKIKIRFRYQNVGNKSNCNDHKQLFYPENIWYVYKNGITSNLYFDNSGNIKIDSNHLFNYKINDLLGPDNIYYKDLSLNIIKFKYPYLDQSDNIIDSTAKWIWSDSSN